MKNWKNLTKRGLSLFIVLVMALSLLPTTAYAANIKLKKVTAYHKNGEESLPSDITFTPADGDQVWKTNDSMELDLWVTTSSMKPNEKYSKVPYYIDENSVEWELKKVTLKPQGSDETDLMTTEEISQATDSAGWTKSIESASAVKQAYVYYYWGKADTEPGGDQDDPGDNKQPYTVKYDLNIGDADGQLPNDAIIWPMEHENINGQDTVSASSLTQPVEPLEEGSPLETRATFDTKVCEGVAGITADTEAKTTSYYRLTGWRCGGTTIPYGDETYKASADLAVNKEITLVAQWEKVTASDTILPVENGEKVLPIISNAGRLNQFSVVQNVDWSKEDAVISYTLSGFLETSVVSHDNTLSDDHARFDITVTMDPALELIGEGDTVPFQFKCGFLVPETESEYDADTDTYTLYLPKSDSNIFVIPMKWKTERSDNASAAITVATPSAVITDRVVDKEAGLKTTATISGRVSIGNLQNGGSQDSQTHYQMFSKAEQIARSLKNPNGTVDPTFAEIIAVADMLMGYTGQGNQFYGKDFAGATATGSATTPIKQHTVAFESNGGTSVAPVTVYHGDSADAPASPTREGHTFSGWYNGETRWNFGDPVTTDLTLVAQWTRNPGAANVTITPSTTSLTGGGTVTLTVVGPEGTTVSASPNVTLTNNGNGTWTVTLPNSTQSYTFTANFGGNDEFTAASASCTVAVTYRGSGGIIITPDPTPTIPDPGPGGTDIPDVTPPLANVDGLNHTDHFAYIAGYPDDTVRPENNITRAEAATIFFRLMTEEFRVANWSTTNDFTDTDPEAWYNAAVSTAAKAGILKGYPDGSFKPNDPITRAEFATLAARFMTDDITDDVGDFEDTAEHWAAKDIRRAVKAGWIRGVGGNKFEPDSSITRAAVVTMVNRMLDRNLVPDADHMLDTMKTWSDNMDTSKWYYLDVQEAGNGHDYEMKDNVETWTELVPMDWTAKEAEWIANNGASAKTDK